MSRKNSYSLEEIKNKIKNNPLNVNQKWELAEEYPEDKKFFRSNRGIKIHCKRHGKISGTKVRYILDDDYLCNLCRKADKKMSIEQLKDEFNKKDYILLTEDFLYAADYLFYICKKHPEKIQKITYDSFIHGHGCKFCAIDKNKMKRRLSFKEIEQRFNKRNYKVVEVFRKNGSTYIKYECKKHPNKIQTIQLSNFINGCGCAFCKRSKGEEKIRCFLEDNDITYIPQKIFLDCRNIEPLPFDFYLPDYNMCIEYQGKQHRKPVNLFGKIPDVEKQKINFSKQLKNDRIKREYCLDNGIKLLCIFDYDFKRIEKILIKELNL